MEKDAMMERSGSVSSNDVLVCFLYVLMRDFTTPGQVEEILVNLSSSPGQEVVFSNGWLAEYSKDVASRLTLAKEE